MGAGSAEGSSSSSNQLNVDEMKQSLMQSVCPMVGVSRCFEANPAECKGMLDQGLLNLDFSQRRLNSRRLNSTLSQEMTELDAACKKEGVSTMAVPSSDKVTTVVTLRGIDYDKVMSDDTVKANIITSVKNQFLAKMPGYLESDLTVTLSKGSVKATVEIVPMPGADASALKDNVENGKAAITTGIVTDVQNMENVDSVLESGTNKDQIQGSMSESGTNNKNQTQGSMSNSSLIQSTTAPVQANAASGAPRVEVSMILILVFASAAVSVY